MPALPSLSLDNFEDDDCIESGESDVLLQLGYRMEWSFLASHAPTAKILIERGLNLPDETEEKRTPSKNQKRLCVSFCGSGSGACS